ncbi:MAG: hypothetical protein ABII80_02085 [bacterium]
MYINRKANKIQQLLKHDRRIFRTSDLAVLWEIQNKNTLLTTIKRYIKRKILVRIKKGVYSTVPLEKLEAYELGCALAGPLSYVSTETVLAQQGVISQVPRKITLMGKKAGSWVVEGNEYWCRYLAPKHLVDRVGIVETTRYAVATPPRAKKDLRRVNPHVYLEKEGK